MAFPEDTREIRKRLEARGSRTVVVRLNPTLATLTL